MGPEAPLDDDGPEAGLFYTFRQHAAVDFGLQAMADTNVLHRLVDLLPDGSPIGAIEGVPGWSLERRDPGNTMPGYANWPEWAAFRAFVDPDEFKLRYPERYYRRDEFLAHVRPIVAAYVARQPDRADMMTELRATIGPSSAETA